MHPLQICKKLGQDRILSICEELNSNQLKTTLRKGGLNPKSSARVVSQKAKRKLWSDRVQKGLDQDNAELAESLLYEWLLYHRRPMLVEYLDRVGVKHQGGETEDTFTKTVPAEVLREGALAIARTRDPVEVAAYLLFLDFHQESDVYGSDPAILALLESTAAPKKPGSSDSNSEPAAPGAPDQSAAASDEVPKVE
ncbi:MAG: hypothetical protein RBU30_05490 [Polyangia bacterium]|jgi:hypothetical protein|nr:hypothetical protein [Polyangia bacterium]